MKGRQTLALKTLKLPLTILMKMLPNLLTKMKIIMNKVTTTKIKCSSPKNQK
jgi:hypothetical protein